VANFPWNRTLSRAGSGERGTGRQDGCLGAGTGAIWPPLRMNRSKLIGAVAADTNLAVGGEGKRVVGIGISSSTTDCVRQSRQHTGHGTRGTGHGLGRSSAQSGFHRLNWGVDVEFAKVRREARWKHI
jgi:hypothetical protein